jgi:hypothetical protein
MHVWRVSMDMNQSDRYVPRILCLFTAIILSAVPGLPAEEEKSRRGKQLEVIGGEPLVQLADPSAFPPIDDPKFVTAAEATFMADDEIVLGVDLGGLPKAYSTWLLEHHEVVNDHAGGRAIAATW